MPQTVCFVLKQSLFFCNQGWPWTPIPRITGWPILCTLSSSHTIIMHRGVKTVFFCCSHRTTTPGQFSGCERFALGWEVCFGITIQQLFSSQFVWFSIMSDYVLGNFQSARITTPTPLSDWLTLCEPSQIFSWSLWRKAVGPRCPALQVAAQDSVVSCDRTWCKGQKEMMSAGPLRWPSGIFLRDFSWRSLSEYTRNGGLRRDLEGKG